MKFHLVGICGTGMGALAGLLKAGGHDVRGSDEKAYPPMSDQLQAMAIPFFEGFKPENLDWKPDQVVVGNVCRPTHVEVVAAKERGLPLTSFPAVLEEAFLADRHSIVVSGTHGKTTTTSLLAWTLFDSGRDPSFLVGGVPQNLGQGYRLGGGEHFVVEGDEYDSAFFDKGSKFFHYRPKTAILTSVELDHVDIFQSVEEVAAAFGRFVELIPTDGLLVVAASSQPALDVARRARCRVETYACGDRAVPGVTPLWRAEIEEVKEAYGRTIFSVTRAGEYVGRYDLGLSGEYNVENALAVIASLSSLGLTQPEIAQGFRRFRGVKRRQELRGIAAGVTVIDDYAHHPTAVRETLAALRKRASRARLVALYEPRSATSRRATFQKEFAESFAAADEVIIYKLFAPESIPAEDRFDVERMAADLRSRGTAAKVINEVDAIVEHVAERVQPGDCVAVFSSGAFGGVHEKLLYRLGDPILAARPEHMGRVREILEKANLGGGDLIEERAGDTLIVADETGIVGCVVVEIYDDAAVLRSLAVVPDRRGRGLGWMLADNAVGRARMQGAKRLYLLTEHATDFFAEKLGFRPLDRALVDPAVTASKHFRESAKSAVAMKLELG